jgi:arylsulfatase A-like enzyme
MQASVPSLTDLSQEPPAVLAMYGPQVREPGTFAYNCLMARRLVERGVRFVQLMHASWDQHNSLTTELYTQCRDTDQPSAALVRDLRQRGLLDDTLVIWGGEFGRTPFLQGNIADRQHWGRDHHPYAFTVWLAGGGVKPGLSYGETDDLAMNVVRDPVHVHDFQATLLYLLGIDHKRLTYRFQGRHFRLTDVHGEVVKGVLA